MSLPLTWVVWVLPQPGGRGRGVRT